MTTEKNKNKKKQASRGRGRPALYQNAEELEAKIKEYFDNPPKKRTIYTKDGEVVEIPVITISGLVLYLGFCDRQSFYDYGNRPEFSCTIKKARSLIEEVYEGLLQGGLGAGAIFALKNFGWIDKQEVDQKVTIDFLSLIKAADADNSGRGK